MMSLPFILVLCALVAFWIGRRPAALSLWALGVVVLIVLFRLHATSALNIVL